jgi:hypothetical protein
MNIVQVISSETLKNKKVIKEKVYLHINKWLK